MFETAFDKPKVILVCVDTGEFDAEVSINELKELAQTAGAQVGAKMIQKRPSKEVATCIGPGRLEELADTCKAMEIDQIIFDHELTATQIRNIENATNTHTIDRTMLILDIFAQRATTKEGRLQVELAQQKYRLPRLAGMGVKLSRLGGGIGTRGPGETKLETDKRHIRTRIEVLSAELKEIEKRRELFRKRRKKDNILTCAIVGYTNVGKSTLLNTLTNAGVLSEDKLFATLETTSRAIELPDGRSITLIDTVGLIRRLPHHLVEAFKSTLEEAANADIILHICDASAEDVKEQAEVTKELLNSLGCSNIPIITVLNKCDKTDNYENAIEDNQNVRISAKSSLGIDKLLNCITLNLKQSSFRANLLIPYDKASLTNLIREDGKIFKEDYTHNGILLDALVDKKIYYKVQDYKI